MRPGRSIGCSHHPQQRRDGAPVARGGLNAEALLHTSRHLRPAKSVRRVPVQNSIFQGERLGFRFYRLEYAEIRFLGHTVEEEKVNALWILGRARKRIPGGRTFELGAREQEDARLEPVALRNRRTQLLRQLRDV